VHQLWPPPYSRKQRTTLDVVFFHGHELDENCTGDAWKSTWTQRGNDAVCWPADWLPIDLGQDVRIISVSYDAPIADIAHNVSGIARNFIQSLMSSRYESPL